MDNIFTAKIQQFLELKKPTDAQIIEGATLLLQLNPNRNRGLYNSALRRPQALLSWIRTDLKKHLAIRKRGLEVSQVEQYNRETMKRVEQTLSVVPPVEPENDCAPAIPILGSRGIREDHDKLPEDIRALWDKNADRWKQLARMHYQLGQMIAKPGYAACDGNELCYQMRQLDDAIRDAYERYDTWQPEYEVAESSDAAADSVDVFTDNVKTIQNARTAVSRGLARKKQTDESLKKIQDAVNTLYALKQAIKPETVEKLKAIGITVPEKRADA